MSDANPITATKPCTRCKADKPFSEFSPNKYGRHGLNPACKACASALSRAYAAAHKESVAARKKAYRDANRDKVSAYNKSYAEKNADAMRDKRIAAYHANKDERRAHKAEIDKAYRERNKPEINARRRERIAADNDRRERNRLASAKWYEENKERASAAAHARYAERREEIKARVRAYEQANIEKAREWGRAKTNKRRARLADGPQYSLADIQRLLVLQRCKCANCGASIKKKYHIDHRIPVAKGGTNDPRNIELLCPSCNLRKSAKLPHEFAQENGRLL